MPYVRTNSSYFPFPHILQISIQTMAMIADKCPEVNITVVDISESRIAAWNSDTLPIYEPGLSNIVQSCRNRNLFFSCDIDAAIDTASVIFLAVQTPTKRTGRGASRASDLSYLESATRRIATVASTPKIIVEKSTVPVCTAAKVEKVLQSVGRTKFVVLSNPEFMSEGSALSDLESPDRVLVGGPQGEALELLVEMYARWVPRDRILRTNVWSAELAKLVGNAMQAQRVSSINAVSALCEKTGADVDEVAHAVGMDSVVGPRFLKSSLGFGGSCFKKDILNLVYISESLGLPEVGEYWYQIVRMNEVQKERFVSRVIRTMFDSVKGKKMTVLGFAFKKNTGDTRESAAIEVCRRLVEEDAQVAIYDPKVCEEQIWKDLSATTGMDEKELGYLISICTDAVSATRGSHAMIVATEWDEFKGLDFERIYKEMERPAFVFDGRNILNHAKLRKIGFVVHAIGKPYLNGQLN